MDIPKALVGITDDDWFAQLREDDRLAPLAEVNFWQPSGSTQFRALSPGEPFLFKLHAPREVIVGGGFFGHFSLLPIDLAWETFGRLNGVSSRDEMRRRIAGYRRVKVADVDARPIGCILLQQPFFFDDDDFLPVPADWASNIVRYKGYDAQEGAGLAPWSAIQARLADRLPQARSEFVAESGPRFGRPRLILPRLGQGSFRVAVLDAYDRRCAITGERTLPVIDSAHIVPHASGGENTVDNGLALRSDLHALYDRGYITVTPELQVEVSRRIREEFENGRDYYALQGRTIRLPRRAIEHPRKQALELHATSVFRS